MKQSDRDLPYVTQLVRDSLGYNPSVLTPVCITGYDWLLKLLETMSGREDCVTFPF